jgi:O-antigen/teichoic acid export membrane protein
MAPEAASVNRKLAVTIGKNAVSLVVLNFVQVATRLITVPIIIAHLGLGGYGIWSIIMASAAYMRFGSAGLKSAFQKYVAEATGNQDYDHASRLLSTGAAVMTGLSLIGLLPVALLSHWMAGAIGVPHEFLNATAHSFTILAFIMMLSNVGGAYESIISGGHRIDLVAKFGVILTVAESIGIVASMYLGYGLLAMTIVMAVSEFLRVTCCWVFASRIVPEVHVSQRYVSRSVLRELARFAGSYQIVNVLEVIYMAIMPVAILKFFGATAAGVYAISDRMIGVALMVQESLLLPLLSGGTMVYASGSAEKMRLLIAKAFKVAFTFTIPLLAFVGAFGSIVLLAWTGQSEPIFRIGLWIICGAGFFKSISRVALILYRSTGGAVMDLVREGVRIGAVLIAAVLGARLGYYGVLGGLALAEFIGLAVMLATLNQVRGFRVSSLVPDALKLMAATAAVIAASFLMIHTPLPWAMGPRWAALARLVEVSITCLIFAWPVIAVTNFLTASERKMIWEVIVHRQKPVLRES